MRIDADFSALWAEVRKISREDADFEFEVRPSAREPLDLELSGGLEVSLADIEFDRGGLASIRGRQVLLYIPDHGPRVAAALQNSRERGNRFHVAFCKKLDEMWSKNRFERYVATNELSGRFKIGGIDYGRPIEGEVELSVCKFCLQKLNYKGSISHPVRQRVATEFSIAEFFETYSSFFRHMPASLQDAPQTGYTKDWADVSAAVRKEARYCCQECAVDLSSAKRLLHVHHRNGVKSDNRRANLAALCADCHRRQPLHDHMHVPHRDMQTINRLRRTQGVLTAGWEEAEKLADPAVHGVLNLLKKKGKRPPEIGYEVQDESGAVVAEFEAAWPGERFAVVLHEEQKKALPRWRVRTVAECLGDYA